jgi:hypothetical protein
MKTPIISKCETLIRELANDVALAIHGKQFKEEIIKKLKFDNENGWSVLCSLMDVLSDTELAKENFLKYDLGGPTKILDYGEQYIRLYGITNALYLQKSAIISFVELVKLSNKTNELKNLNECKILEFRNIVGAHTVDFIKNDRKNPHQFQRYFGQNSSITVSDSDNNYTEYNLKQLILDYNVVAEGILIRATEKFIRTVLKNGGAKKDLFLKKMKALTEANKTGMAIWPDPLEELFIISVNEGNN